MNATDLNPEYAFVTFVIGDSNRFAHDTTTQLSAQYMNKNWAEGHI